MGIREWYQSYENAFEKTFVDDDWSRVERCFAEDAVHESDPVATGRAAVIAKLKAGVDRFDRKMDNRTAVFQTPKVDGNMLQNRWTVTYQKAGAPDLEISGLQTVIFEGEHISSLCGDWDLEGRDRMAGWMAEHGTKLHD